MARLRKLAIARGAVPVLTWELSSWKVTSRGRCQVEGPLARRFRIGAWRGAVSTLVQACAGTPVAAFHAVKRSVISVR